MTDDLVVILTALNLEYAAVRARLVDPQLHRHPRGTRFEVGTVLGTRCRVALGLVGKGNQAAAVLAERAIQEFSPEALLFTGVAGALWDGIALGDIVFATQVYAYHGGTSEDDGFKARPRSWEAPHDISQLAAHLGRVGDWASDLSANERAPVVHFGPIAAGEIVQNSRISEEARWIREHYNDALAIEMEGAGAAQAGHLSGSPVAVIRAISDMANGTKTGTADITWQPRAAANAAAFAVRLAETLVMERERAAMRENTAGNGTAVGRNAGTVNNYATGQVGIQAAHVTGSTVWIGAAQQTPAPTDLAAEMSALRDLLGRERSAGRIDDTTYEAAKVELDIADGALGSATPEGRRTFILALKRLRGLLADITDLATRVVVMLVAVKTL